MRFVIGAVCAALACILLAGVGSYQAGEKKDPKYSIKEVMKIAHKEGLLKKVASGAGEKEDARQLVELYTALGQNKPPAGEQEQWVKVTQRMLAAAKLAAKGDPGAAKALKAAVQCKNCHDTFKG